jgi:hypothetical protein
VVELHARRLEPAKEHARRTRTLNVVRNHSASARRRTGSEFVVGSSIGQFAVVL